MRFSSRLKMLPILLIKLMRLKSSALFAPCLSVRPQELMGSALLSIAYIVTLSKGRYQGLSSCSFLARSCPKSWKRTLITLIPKTQVPCKVTDYRPISFCTFIYKKICTKILSNRLKRVLPNIISPEQAAFISGRSIRDNILLVTEIKKKILSRHNRSAAMVIKPDLEKHRVSWNLIEQALTCLGFPRPWISWIMGAITSPEYAFKLNGNLAAIKRRGRGIRREGTQG